MTNAKTFGRRRPVAAAYPVREAKPPAFAPAAPPQQPAVSPPATPAVSVEEELRLWKADRRRAHPFPVPWRQLYLVASVSFGIASLVLPDSVNDIFDWLLYALSAASLIAWFRGRGKSVAPPA